MTFKKYLSEQKSTPKTQDEVETFLKTAKGSYTKKGKGFLINISKFEELTSDYSSYSLHLYLSGLSVSDGKKEDIEIKLKGKKWIVDISEFMDMKEEDIVTNSLYENPDISYNDGLEDFTELIEEARDGLDQDLNND